MEKLISEQSFYPKLNNEIKALLFNLCKAYKHKKLVDNTTIYAYFFIGILFLFSFKKIIFEEIYITNLNTFFIFLKLFMMIGGLLLITESITKSSDNRFEKTTKKLKSYLILDVCNCTEKCSCKKDLIKFLSYYGIYLI